MVEVLRKRPLRGMLWPNAIRCILGAIDDVDWHIDDFLTVRNPKFQ
jgi:hypothetical protein